MIILMILAGIVGYVCGVHLPWYGILIGITLHFYFMVADKYGAGLGAIVPMVSVSVLCIIMLLSGLIHSEVGNFGTFMGGLKFIFTGG